MKFPDIKVYRRPVVTKSSVYVGGVGFEDRCLAWMDRAIAMKCRLNNVIAITYLPHNSANRVTAFKNRLRKLQVPHEQQFWLKYDRFEPSSVGVLLAKTFRQLGSQAHVILDISGMSKLLIVIMLIELDKHAASVDIVFAEAGVYFPLKEQFEQASDVQPITTFLTRDVYNIVTTDRLSAIAMQGCPAVIIAFGTFNFRELDALVNELSPQLLVLIFGVPHHPEDLWRLDAVKQINRKLDNFVKLESRVMSTFDYEKTLTMLEEVYSQYSRSHRILIAPTGSKLQAVAVAFFKYLHPEVQILYPVTTGYFAEYTSGCKELWAISVADWVRFVEGLDRHRRSALDHLKLLIRAQRA